jgi:deoxyribodipyrimidine photo-lyase
LILEQDAVAIALAEHGPEEAEKFIQEVFWRSYFKGWLERRPQVWESYGDGVKTDRDLVAQNGALTSALRRAESGQTGIECFDAWADELLETGYLHNHARMWFASIWIFTLRLPWRLGADFFYRNLLDGDPASNTLSWRWIGGLHTRGKFYAAQAWNISKFTESRFNTAPGVLADVSTGLEASEPEGLPDLQPLRRPKAPRMGKPTLFLITEEDCRPEDFDVSALDIQATATLSSSHLRSDAQVAQSVIDFERGALADTSTRLGGASAALRADDPDAFATWVAAQGITQVVTPYIPIGPLRDWMLAAGRACTPLGIEITEMRRDWDTEIWPSATAGFFKVKKKIPQVLERFSML